MTHRLAAVVVVIACALAIPCASSADADGTAAASQRVLFSEYGYFGSLRARPSSVHGGSDFGWVDLAWSSWGGPSATGTGFYYLDDKSEVPYVRNRYPVRLTLSKVRRCLGVLYYSRMVTEFTASDPAGQTGTRETVSYPCPADQYTIRAQGSSRSFGKVQAIGDFRPRSDPTLGSAVGTFAGEASRRRLYSETCRVRWSEVGVTIVFSNFGGNNPCSDDGGLAQKASISGPLWQTVKGLQVGDSVSKLRRLYPNARRFGSTWRLVSAVTFIGDRRRYTVLGAVVPSKRVRSFSVYIGAAGD